jgi:choline dehydrogenase-like flavoprotein
MGKVFDPYPGVTMISYDLQPSSRGQVRLASKDAAAAPLLTHNYLQTERDQQVAVDSIRTTRRIMRQDALKPYAPRENWAGDQIHDSDRAGLLQVFRENCASIFHPAGTARMGLAADAQSVVAADLKVHGVAGLRVCDASVMPTLVSGNTAWPTLMIAEKAAEAIQRSASGR